jgi:hypothetical protein
MKKPIFITDTLHIVPLRLNQNTSSHIVAMQMIRIAHMLLLQRSIALINLISVLLTLALLSNTFGIFDLSLLHLIVIYLFLGITLLNLPLIHTITILRTSTPSRKKTSIGIMLLTAAFLILLLSTTQSLWIASIPLLITGINLLSQAGERKQKELPLLAVACFGYAVVYLLIQTIPLLWYSLQQTSLFLSHAVGVITGTPLLLGPTTSGFWILLIFLTFLSSSFLLVPKKTRKDILWFIECIAGLFLLWVLYLSFLSIAPSISNTDTIGFHPVFFSLCLIPLFLYLFRYPFKEPIADIPPMKIKVRILLKTGAVWAAILLLLSTSLFTIVINTDAPIEYHQKVLFYGEHMLGTWDTPQYGKYGKDGVGMFGLWPIYLTTLGYESELLVENKTAFLNITQPPNQNITQYLNFIDYVSIIESPKITKDVLKDTSIFVVTNLNLSFTPEEQAIIWDFVNNGGSLLVLGDHTNVGGMQYPLNELLSPVGISFRFNAALPLDETNKWLTCTRFLQHPVTMPLKGIDELQYGVGASLNISTVAFPVVIGTYALSDQGNQSGADLAYLGDYTYNKGEQLGDVILVAASYYGQGKVLVFGDTSSFQNTALPFSYPFLESTFSWLSSTQNGTINTLQVGFSILLLIGAVLVYRFSKNNAIPFVSFPVMFVAALFLTTSLNPVFLSNTTQTGPLVTIDASHIERFAQEPFTDESINGLILNLQRNNYLPILLREFSHDAITAGRILVFIAPTASFTEDEITFLKQYMTDGGSIILTAGYDDRGASLPLLQLFNISIEPTPLGPVPYVEGNTTNYESEPRFVDSWPLVFPQNQATSYYNFTWDDITYHLVIFEKYRRGGLLIITDSQFLLDKNIESIYDYWPGNIIFIKYLLNELQTMEEQR